MRTTILIDDHLCARFRAHAQAHGKSLSEFLADAGRQALERDCEAPDAQPFRLVTFGNGGPLPGVDLDRTSELLAAEDAARFGEVRG